MYPSIISHASLRSECHNYSKGSKEHEEGSDKSEDWLTWSIGRDVLRPAVTTSENIGLTYLTRVSGDGHVSPREIRSGMAMCHQGR